MDTIDRSRFAYFSGRPGQNIVAADIDVFTEMVFWSYVDISLTRPCWLWIGQAQGPYGRFKIGKRRYQAHRLSYAFSWGWCDAHMVVRHKCDNGLCVAPHHLELGSDSDNMADKLSRGRQSKGEMIGSSILTESQIRMIRSDPRTARQVGISLGVKKSTVQKIRQGINWKHVK